VASVICLGLLVLNACFGHRPLPFCRRPFAFCFCTFAILLIFWK
jgi:hypothetical protein